MFNFKEYFKLTSVYTFFSAFPAILQIFVYPIIEGKNRLGASDFGHLEFIEVIISLCTIFIVLGAVIAVSRFYYDYNESEKDLNSLISSITSGIIIRFFILLGITFLIAPLIGKLFHDPDLQQFHKYGPLLIVAALTRSITGVATMLFRNEKRVRNFIIVSFFYAVFRSGFQLIGVLYFDMSFLGFVYGTAIGGAIVSIGVIIYLYKRCGVKYKKDILKPVYSFSIPLVFNDLIFWGIVFIDRFFMLSNPHQLGIYGNAMKFAMGIQLLLQGMASAVQPELFRLFKQGVDKTQKEIKTISNLFIVQSILIVAISVIPTMLFITSFYETDLLLSAGLLPIIFTRFILIAQYQVYSWGAIYMKKTKLFFIINAFVFTISVFLNYFLIPPYGYYGAIITFLIAYTLQVFFFRLASISLLKIQWNDLKMFYFPLSIVFLACIIEFFKLKYQLNQFLTSGMFTLYIIISLLLLYKNEVKRIMNKIKTQKLNI